MFYVDYHPELQREFDREEGMNKGILMGDSYRVISLIRAKYLKNMPLSQIADELEDTTDHIRPFYDIIAQHPSFTVEEIYKIHQQRKVVEEHQK